MFRRTAQGEGFPYFFFGSMTFAVGYLTAYALFREEGLAIILANALAVAVAMTKGYARADGMKNMIQILIPTFIIDIILVTIS